MSERLGAAWARFPQFAALPDSLRLDAPVMLHGRLTDTSGAPLAGAAVLLAAWPSNDTVHALPIGGRFSITPVARTVAGADGTYELRSALTPLLASLATKDGLDVELDVFHGGRHYVYLSQVVPDATIGGWVYRAVTDPLTEAPSVRANSRNALNVALDPRNGQKLSRELLRAPVALPGEQPPPAPPACGRYEKFAVDKALTTVATAVARNGVAVTVEYSEAATSELSTGASTDGVHFSASGTRSRTSGRGAEWEHTARRGKTLNREYQIQWLHTTTRRLCAADFRGNYDPAYMTSPDRSTGGATFSAGGRRNPTWECWKEFQAPADSGRVWTDDQRAKTYEGAFGITPTDRGSLIGSARSGYSEAVKITFTMPKIRSGYWCGDSGDPGANNQRLQGVQP